MMGQITNSILSSLRLFSGVSKSAAQAEILLRQNLHLKNDHSQSRGNIGRIDDKV